MFKRRARQIMNKEVFCRQFRVLLSSVTKLLRYEVTKFGLQLRLVKLAKHLSKRFHTKCFTEIGIILLKKC